MLFRSFLSLLGCTKAERRTGAANGSVGTSVILYHTSGGRLCSRCRVQQSTLDHAAQRFRQSRPYESRKYLLCQLHPSGPGHEPRVRSLYSLSTAMEMQKNELLE